MSKDLQKAKEVEWKGELSEELSLPLGGQEPELQIVFKHFKLINVVIMA